MISDIQADAEQRMQATVEACRRDLAALRAGRASPTLLDKIRVDYYGKPTPINELANISVPEPRLLVIQPWDRNVLPEVERAILKSDLGLSPVSDGKVLRLAIPQLTEERRMELARQARKLAEDGRVAIRNVRRDANDTLKDLEREGEASEDDVRRAMEEIQKLTDRYSRVIDELLSAKEEDILAV